ncbi:hypothetical protein TEA_027915 [Camellia sinensis var. sinensis]|uniref:C3H1-type domain-containing protein n=1 Tax=Camellia sinensis var. sinensis TaxID=542762 RepID=A0A4S4DIT1_CAMSN|nr:hypothetical protein TEA_027915 [Camellia sinensis var. sinensis]
MGSICGESHQQHKFHPSQQLLLLLTKKTMTHLNIPPRKLLLPTSIPHSSLTLDSLRSEEALHQNFLPYNGLHDDDDEQEEEDSTTNPYSSDHFRIYEFKVRRCPRSRTHDWTDCPFAHPGEKARRRDPRRFHYSGTVCPDFRRGSCSRGDNCEFAHGVFECWLHPARYRTEACKDGENCKRKVCFFAHSPRQLRLLSPPEIKYYRNSIHCCCPFCHSVSASPTSTLMGLSPPISPPLSYKDVLTTELMSSLESMNLNEDSHTATTTAKGMPNAVPKPVVILPDFLSINAIGEDQLGQNQKDWLEQGLNDLAKLEEDLVELEEDLDNPYFFEEEDTSSVQLG